MLPPPVSASAATPTGTDPGDSFCPNLLPRHENILLSDIKYFKTTTTCRRDNFQQNIYFIWFIFIPFLYLHFLISWYEEILKTFLTQAEFNDHALLRAQHAMRTSVLLSFERILSFPLWSAPAPGTRPNLSNPDLTLIKSLYHERYFIRAVRLRDSEYNNKSVLRVSFSLICHSGNISNETKRETEKKLEGFPPL